MYGWLTDEKEEGSVTARHYSFATSRLVLRTSNVPAHLEHIFYAVLVNLIV